jgi:membrane associated rhomboid family serine protease
MFMHGSIFHLAGNMLFLWIFGNNIEDSLGRVKFLLFYLAAGAAAIALQTVITTGDDTAIPMIGASGAIAGVLGGYILLYPRARVLTVVLIILFFTIIRIPAILMLGVWFAQQALLGAAGLTETVGGGDGVAYFAHIGGFVFGVAAIGLLRPVKNPVYEQLLAERAGPHARSLDAPESPRAPRSRRRW